MKIEGSIKMTITTVVAVQIVASATVSAIPCFRRGCFVANILNTLILPTPEEEEKAYV